MQLLRTQPGRQVHSGSMQTFSASQTDQLCRRGLCCIACSRWCGLTSVLLHSSFSCIKGMCAFTRVRLPDITDCLPAWALQHSQQGGAEFSGRKVCRVASVRCSRFFIPLLPHLDGSKQGWARGFGRGRPAVHQRLAGQSAPFRQKAASSAS